MKKISMMILLSVAVLSVVDGRLFAAVAAVAAPPANYPPEQLDAPAVQPAGIRDPQLLAAWVRVYQQPESIEYEPGVAVSGRSLAEYLLQQNIPVVWAAGDVCGSGSCSQLTCAAEQCRYASQAGGAAAPIYVTPSERGDLPALTSTLAHEIFHRTQPFGPVGDTRYEEYWAFQVGARVAHTPWPKFDGYNPLDPDQLNVWFQVNGLAYYFKFPAYPAAVAARANRVSGGGDPYSGLPTLFYGTTLTH